MKENKRKNKGITIISLIITIVIMLILAGVTINVSVDGGLFGQAQSAKNSAEKAQDIEKINKAIIYAKEKDRSGKITVENLQKELSEANVFEETGTIIVNLNGTYYEVGENGKIEELGGAIEKELKIICKDSDGNKLAEKTHTIIKSKYSVVPPEVEGYEASVEIIEGEISESTIITQLYYIIYDEEEINFTEINTNGEITYYANGIKSGENKNIKSVLRIPETYKLKPVTTVGGFANWNYKIQKVNIPDTVKELKASAFQGCGEISELIVGANLTTIGHQALNNLSGLKTVIYNR